MTDWTWRMEERLIELEDEGLTFKEIAPVISKEYNVSLTKGAVCTKAWKLRGKVPRG